MKLKVIIITASLITLSSIDLLAQFNKSFSHQKAMYLSIGDTLFVHTSAIVLDSLEFEKIRINLDEYKSLKLAYLNNIHENKKLIAQLSKSQNRLSALLENNELQAKELSKLRSLAEEMSKLSGDMKSVNDGFEHNNKAFDKNLEAMKKNNEKLNKEINRIKIRNIKSHVIIGLIGATLGFLIASSI